MRFDYSSDAALDPRPPVRPIALWLLLAIIGAVLGSAALIAAVSGSPELAGAHLALRKGSIL